MINENRLRAAARNFRAIFFQALEQNSARWRELIDTFALEVTSVGDSENYNWLGAAPLMAEWTGERNLQDLAAYGNQIVNKSWANGIKVQKETIDDDKLGLVRPRIIQIAEQYWYNRWVLVRDVITKGVSVTTCYDGQYLLSASHSSGKSGTQSNLITDLLDADSYAKARQYMRTFKNDVGQYMGLMGTHLVVCPALEAMGREILLAERNALGATNVWRGTAELVVVEGFDQNDFNANKAWALIDRSKPLKPVIDQIREAVVFAALEKPDDYNVFMNRWFGYGADYRGNAGAGLWQTIVASDGSGT